MKRYPRGPFVRPAPSSSIFEYVAKDGADCVADKFSPSGRICHRKAGDGQNGGVGFDPLEQPIVPKADD